jgi:thiol-disulfide isomerase/thioredoxin
MQVVKNIEECQIANFLIVNNMSYEYDYPYEVETVTDSYPQYKPQFTIRQGDQSVLLHFWATWCSDCMKKLLIIKEIGNEYGQKDLQIISIASKSNHHFDFVEAIRKYQMDWIKIYDDRGGLEKNWH